MGEKSAMYPPLDDPTIQHNNAPPSYDQSFNNNPGPNMAGQPMAGFPPGSGLPPIQQQPMQQGPIYVTASAIPPLGPSAVSATCPNCGQKELTNVIFEAGSKTHIMALVLCVFGMCCCACIPYCVNSCQNANHYCRNCNQYLGTYGNNNC